MKIGNQGVLNTSIFKHAENRQDAKILYFFFRHSPIKLWRIRSQTPQDQTECCNCNFVSSRLFLSEKRFFFLFFSLAYDAKVCGNRIELPYVGALYRHTCIFIPSFFLRRYYMCDVCAISTWLHSNRKIKFERKHGFRYYYYISWLPGCLLVKIGVDSCIHFDLCYKSRMDRHSTHKPWTK